MEINTKVRIAIMQEGAEVGAIRLDPSDVGFMEKVYDTLDDFKRVETEYAQRAEELEKDEQLDDYGIPQNARQVLALWRELIEYMYGRIDTLFGDGVSKMAFGETRSIYAVYDFFDQLTPYLEQAQAERIKKYTNRAQRRAALRK